MKFNFKLDSIFLLILVAELYYLIVVGFIPYKEFEFAVNILVSSEKSCLCLRTYGAVQIFIFINYNICFSYMPAFKDLYVSVKGKAFVVVKKNCGLC